MRHSRNKTVYQSKFRRLWLALERLEQRQLMAADFADSFSSKLEEPSSIDKLINSIEEQLAVATPTHSYSSDAGPVSLVIHPAKIALQLKDGVDSAAIEAMGFEFERGIGSEYGVYTAVSGSVNKDELMASGLVQASTSVFFAQATQSEAVLLDELIVSLKPGVSAEAFFKNNPDFVSYEPLRGTHDQFVAKVKAGTGPAALEVANRIDDDSRLQFVSPNFYQNWQKSYTPNDPRIANQWHLNNTGQGGGLIDADSDVLEAWDIIQGGSSNLVVGVIDDGVAAHPDLNLWVNTAESEGLVGVDDDNNGWVDDVNGWNFVFNNSNSGTPSADDMHGTAVAGVAAGIGDNGVGVAGASYKSRVLSAKIFQGTSVASDANIAGALYYAAGRTANGLSTWRASDIVNNSWSGGANSTAINAALTWGTTNGRLGKGAPLLFATGNGFGAVQQPALQSLNIPGVFAVGATNNRGTRSDYSNFGAAVDLVAPSDDTRAGYLTIDTTDRVGADGYAAGDYTGTGATGFGGTSSATPLAAGITALVMAQADVLGVVLNPAQLRSYIRANTDLIAGAYDTTTGKNLEYGFGRINAFSAVSNLGKPEISVVTSTSEVQSGESLNVGNAFVDDFIDTTVRIRNQGTLPLVLGSINIGTGPFTLLTGLGATTLGIGESTTFTVRFTPTAGGAANQTISIGSNDTSESTFSLELSGVGILPTFAGSVFEDWDGDNTKDAIDPSLVGNVIYIDANNNGSLDAIPNTFTNTTTTPLIDSGTVTSTINVAGLTTSIFDVNVKINVNHTWLSDLRVTLISPSGTQVILANQIGGSSDNFVNTVFDDEAAVAIGSGTAPFTGSFRPSQPLTAFDNLAGNGTWTLRIEDLAADDTGTLLNWELTISTSEQFATVRSNGLFGIVGAPVGTHVVRSHSPFGWTTGPTYTMTVASPTDSFKNLDFGIARNNRFYAQVFDDIDADGIWDPTEVAATGRSLLNDSNNNGVADNNAPVTLTNSTAVPIADQATRTSVISASGLTGTITDVNVRVNLTHTFNGDLDVFLVAPDGTRVELFTDIGGASTNFIDTVLDAQAATAISAGTAPYTGTFRPEGNLNTLNGKAPNGNWTLEVTDDASGDVGTINNWSVIITTGEELTAVPSTGLLPLDLTAGPHNMRLMSQSGWRYTLPSTGLHAVTAAGTPLQDRRFGTRLNNVAPTVNVNNATVSVSEGVTVVNGGTWSDPNPTDAISFSASIGSVTFASGTWSWSLPTTDDTPSTLVTITANDGQGGITNATFSYTVTNTNPLITVNNASVSTAVPGVVTNSGTWSDVAADTVTLTSSAGTVVKNANGTWDWSINTTAPVSNQNVTITATDEDGGSAFVTFMYSATTTITNTKAYYKGSFYSAGGANVPAALDNSKSLLQAGASPAAASFANVTNYSRGINGVVMDVLGLSATTLTASDFTFKMSPQGAYNESTNPPSSWGNAPTPTSITVTSGTPTAGTSRIRIEWPDNQIQDRWLQIRVLPNANTGLQSAATYYLGNLRGEIDGTPIGGLLILQNADLTAALPVGGVGSVSNVRDVDKNGFILNSDFVIIRSGINAGLSLRIITIPAAGSPSEAFAPGGGGNKLDGDQKGGGITTFNSPSFAAGTVARDGSTSSPVLGSSITVGLMNSTSSVGKTLDLITNSVESRPASAQQPAISSLNKKAKALDLFFAQLGNQL